MTGNWFWHPIEDSFKAFHDLCFPHEPVLDEPKKEIESLDFGCAFGCFLAYFKFRGANLLVFDTDLVPSLAESIE